MCYCARRKVDWYLSRNLANIVSENPTVFQLKFQPKGKGYSLYPELITKRFNICVVCGDTDPLNLTKHHCVPSRYRKLFPHQYKARASHDIVPLCPDCHEKYERSVATREIEKSICEEIGVETISPEDEEYNRKFRTIALAKNIIKYGESIPTKRLSELEQKIKSVFNIPNITKSELKKLIKETKLEPGLYRLSQKSNWDKAVKNHLKTHDAIDIFIKRWRQHFVDTMKPQFLPDFWSVDMPIFIP